MFLVTIQCIITSFYTGQILLVNKSICSLSSISKREFKRHFLMSYMCFQVLC